MPVIDGRDGGAIARAAARLAAGGLVAFPTETVYGLGARADDDHAVSAIFAAKGRPPDHPLIVHVADAAAATGFASPPLPPAAQALMAACWPGPLTLIVPRRDGRGAGAAAGQPSIGLRMPSHPVARALLRAAADRGVAGIAAPSANRYGRVSPTTAAHVAAELGPDLLVVDGGACDLGIESAIVDCTRAAPALLRPGTLDRRAIEAVLGAPLAAPDAASPRAPGTLEAHYAPRARVLLLDSVALTAALGGPLPAGLAVYSRAGSPAPAGVARRTMPGAAEAAAHVLYADLRAFDDDGATLIWVERPLPEPAWDGVRDRLQRAAAAAR